MEHQIYKLRNFVIIILMILAGCGTPHTAVDIVLVTPERIDGSIIALLDSDSIPALFQKNRFVLCNNLQCNQILKNFFFKGTIIDYRYDRFFSGIQYSDIVTLLTYDQIDNKNYLYAFGHKDNTTSQKDNLHISFADTYIQILYKELNALEIIGIYNDNISNSPIWLLSSNNYNTMIAIDAKGHNLYSYSNGKPTKYAIVINRYSRNVELFSYDCYNIRFYKPFSGNITECCSIPCVTATSLSNVNLKPSKQYSSNPYSYFVSLYNGEKLYIIDIKSYTIIIEKYLNNIAIGPSYLFYFSSNATYYLEYDYDDAYNPMNVCFNKLTNNNKLLWYYNNIYKPNVFEMTFAKNNKDKVILVYITRKDNIYDYNFRNDQTTTILNTTFDFSLFVPYQSSSQGYLYTDKSVFFFK